MNSEALGLLIKYIIPDIEKRILYKFENNEALGLLIKYIIPDIEKRILYKFENSGLTEREIFVLKRKWFDGLSFAEIGKSLTRPVSRKRIRQIEAKAFRKLKHPSCHRPESLQDTISAN